MIKGDKGKYERAKINPRVCDNPFILKKFEESIKAKVDGETFELKLKTFKTGNIGYHTSGTLIRENKPYIVNIFVVEEISKKKANKK